MIPCASAEGRDEDPILLNFARAKASGLAGVEEGAVAAMLGGQGFQPPPPSTMADCDAHIQVIGGSMAPPSVGLAGGFVHPLLQGIMSQRPTLTHKNMGGWKTFERKWTEHLEYVLACNRGMQPPDSLLLGDLRLALDPADQALLERRRDANPRLSYKEFFEELQSLYDRDTVAQQRVAWESLRLPPGDLTLDKWLEFIRNFQLLRDRVEDWTPQEEHRLLLSQLPRNWQRDVLREEAKRQKKRWLVRITNLPHKSPLVLQNDLQMALGEAVEKVLPVSNGIVVICGDATLEKKVLSLHGWTLDGHIVKTSRVDSTLSGEEICEFVSDRLTTELKLERLQTLGFQTREVSAVSQQPKGGKQGSQGQGSRAESPNRQGRPNSPKGKGPSSPKGGGGQTQGKSKGQQKGGQEKGKGGQPVVQGADKPWCQHCADMHKNPFHHAHQCTEWVVQVDPYGEHYCWTCEKLKIPHLHAFRTCPRWLAFQQTRMQKTQQAGRGPPPRANSAPAVGRPQSPTHGPAQGLGKAGPQMGAR